MKKLLLSAALLFAGAASAQNPDQTAIDAQLRRDIIGAWTTSNTISSEGVAVIINAKYVYAADGTVQTSAEMTMLIDDEDGDVQTMQMETISSATFEIKDGNIIFVADIESVQINFTAMPSGMEEMEEMIVEQAKQTARENPQTTINIISLTADELTIKSDQFGGETVVYKRK